MEVQWHVDAIDVGILELECTREELCKLAWHLRADLHAYSISTPSTLANTLGDSRDKIVGFVFSNIDVSITRHAEEMTLLDTQTREKDAGMRPNDILEQHIVMATSTCELDQPRQSRRQLHNSNLAFVLVALFIDESKRNRQRSIEQAWKRVSRIKCKGREHRHDVVEEITLKIYTFFGGEFFMTMQMNSLAFERRHNRLAPNICLPLVHWNQSRSNLAHLFKGRHSVRGKLRYTGVDLLLQPCYANHEELVKIRREDRQELQSLKERMREIFGLFEDALVELDP